MADRRVVVVGAGVMGSAAAWSLARRGIDVLLLERYAPAHHRGSSHGAMRNFNTSYSAEPYVSMLVESRRLYGELGAGLIEQVGLLRHGGSPVYADVVAALASVGQAAEMLRAGEAQQRWPQLRIDREALWIPEAGRVRAEDAWRSMQAATVADGGEVRFDAAVETIRVREDDLVEVRLEDGTVTAERVVVTVGGWTSKLLGPALPLPRLRVTQEQPAHFRPLDPDLE